MRREVLQLIPVRFDRLLPAAIARDKSRGVATTPQSEFFPLLFPIRLHGIISLPWPCGFEEYFSTLTPPSSDGTDVIFIPPGLQLHVQSFASFLPGNR
jgi:hypothetical protein